VGGAGAHGVTIRGALSFVERPNSTDRSVVREIWDENVYHVHEGDFAASGVALDIGANIGAFALYAARCGARRVIAYEPDLDNFRILQQNLARHAVLGRVVEPVRAAVWQHGTELALSGRHGCVTTSEAEAGEGSVPALSLEQVFEVHGVAECAVLKLDVEGAEYPIFRGASCAVLDRCLRIVLEFHAVTDDVFGRMVAQLTRTHKFNVLGSIDRGGYIWAERY
jgi:FkbM family methyltransferase